MQTTYNVLVLQRYISKKVSEVTQSCPTLCDPMNPPGSSVHGILQARVLERVAISDAGIKPGSPAFRADALTSELPRKAKHIVNIT